MQNEYTFPYTLFLNGCTFFFVLIKSQLGLSEQTSLDTQSTRNSKFGI